MTKKKTKLLLSTKKFSLIKTLLQSNIICLSYYYRKIDEFYEEWDILRKRIDIIYKFILQSSTYKSSYKEVCKESLC